MDSRACEWIITPIDLTVKKEPACTIIIRRRTGLGLLAANHYGNQD